MKNGFTLSWLKNLGKKQPIQENPMYCRTKVRALHKVGHFITCTVEWGFDGAYWRANPLKSKKYLPTSFETREPYENVREAAFELLCDKYEMHTEFM